MAKSSLSGSRLRRPEDSAVTTFPIWSYELLIDNFVTSVDLKRLAQDLCDTTKKKQDIQQLVTRYAYAFKQELDRQTAHATLYNSFQSSNNIWYGATKIAYTLFLKPLGDNITAIYENLFYLATLPLIYGRCQKGKKRD